MNNPTDKIRNSLRKREEAIIRHNERREIFLKTKKEITKDIEAAKKIWNQTKNQVPQTEFE
ncbi:MAG: hypothetical protein AB9882_11810 [Ignavibacteriaceae bacterium]